MTWKSEIGLGFDQYAFVIQFNATAIQNVQTTNLFFEH